MRGHVRKRLTWEFIVDVGPHPLTGKRRQKNKSGFATKKEAESALHEFIRYIEGGGRPLSEARPTRRVLDRWLEYQRARGIRERTLEAYQGYIRRELVPVVGGLEIAKLRPGHVRAILTQMQQRGLSTATIAQARASLAPRCAKLWRRASSPRIPSPRSNGRGCGERNRTSPRRRSWQPCWSTPQERCGRSRPCWLRSPGCGVRRSSASPGRTSTSRAAMSSSGAAFSAGQVPKARTGSTRNGRPSAVLLSAEEYEALEETLEIHQDKDLMDALHRSDKDLKAGPTYLTHGSQTRA